MLPPVPLLPLLNHGTLLQGTTSTPRLSGRPPLSSTTTSGSAAVGAHRGLGLFKGAARGIALAVGIMSIAKAPIESGEGTLMADEEQEDEGIGEKRAQEGVEEKEEEDEDMSWDGL